MLRVLSLLSRVRGPAVLALTALLLPATARAQTCARTITADVVAFDQVFFWNRLGAVQPQGMMFALRRDVVPISGSALSAGNVRLRADKRPRPMVLRMNVGDCLRINFQNLLSPTRRDGDQPATRWASIHAIGMQLTSSNLDGGSYVGANPNGLVDVGGSAVYTLYAEREGEHVLVSGGALAGGEGDGGQVNSGLFGAILVEPPGARWYRSQVTRQEIDYATTGTTSLGHPVLNYEALYPAGHPKAGTPVLNMLNGTEIVHTDLTAVIAGSAPNSASAAGTAGWFPAGTFPVNQNVYPQREQPFREYTIIYHDEIGAVQAFPEFEQPQLQFTLHSGRDAFAINYGTGGIGAEVLANRFRVGPMANCTECKYEEFFLSAWTVGDPAMIVDRPANVPCGIENSNPNSTGQDPNFSLYTDNLQAGTPCSPLTGAKATKAFFPDDPSNVYHGYMNDHTRFRVLHAGTKEHHIHHLHAHQWQYSADSDKSTLLDSQAIGPGASFTAEIAHHGGGNLNHTPGDAIFHCHFYPHFAQGMWSLWRVHDVFERGTVLDGAGRPVGGANRALPDGEIASGTPIPAIVPLPGRPMAPMPGASVAIVNGQPQVSGAGNPGYPFYVPAVAGHRPPHPPLDTMDDGGLPRHRINGGTFTEAHTRLDFHKELLTANAEAIPESGTTIEQQAMAFHEQAFQNSCEPNGLCNLSTQFVTNGRARTNGAPFADPCTPATAASPRIIKAADIEDDVKINKAGWHFPQQRFSALWEDVDDYLGLSIAAGGATNNGSLKRPPEPLFFRANSNTCISFWLTNLVPKEYQLDDFQVRTPTDIVGQHIHLVKFDVTASDGSGNGFNYEDGSFSPGEVVERIRAIRAFNGCAATDARDGTFTCPVPKVHPFFGSGPDKNGDGLGDWVGAQTTVQRWFADQTKDNAGNDRTVRTAFTHDHFGPSTHQQTGLYAGLVIEPTGSSWYHNETGAPLGGRHDGGPTTWQAVINPPTEPDYREFLLEFGDFQLAYEPGGNGFPDPGRAINPPGKQQVGLPDLLRRPQACPGSGAAPPCPELISADDPGTMSVNYRNEPLALRVRDPFTNSQAAGKPGDLSYAFASIARSDTSLNSQPSFYQPLTNDLDNYDPFTPMMRAYENDRVQVRVLVGAHEEGHVFNIHGVKWLFEPSEPNSGYRNSQMMGISEHFEFIIPQLIKNPNGNFSDRLWSAGSSTDDFWNGLWGVLRSYTGLRPDLFALPDNSDGRGPIDPTVSGAYDFSCPKTAPVRTFDVSAVTAAAALPSGKLFYNNRTDGAFGPLWDPTSILYVRSGDLDVTGKLKPALSIRPEPLIIRALAGDCIKLTLRNKLPTTLTDLDGYNTLPMIVENFNANDVRPSSYVGLHPQLLHYDVSRFDGTAVGRNKDQLVVPGQFTTYEWYAGDVRINEDTTITATPIEFGATNLISSDRIEHASKGAIGALIIEPQNGFISEYNPNRRAEANINGGSEGGFREFVMIYQNDVNMRTDQSLNPLCFPSGPTPGTGQGWPVDNLACIEDPEDSGQDAINYTTEPLWKRMQHSPATPLTDTDDFSDWWDVLSNTKVGANPQTPIFQAVPGQKVRFRILMPGGHSRNIVFAVDGHVWDREPYIQNSTQQGRNSFSFWEGAQMGHGPTNHFDVLLRNGAGGKFTITGDYLFRDQVSLGLDNGLWGIFRVQ
ncbi:MAG TPA: copper oxidase [Thermoanaerobaculia bacterium]|nr:copper oxidase [Thermoanaerobaculia bacterium]